MKIFPELVKAPKSARGHTIIKDEPLIKNYENWIFQNFKENT